METAVATPSKTVSASMAPHMVMPLSFMKFGETAAIVKVKGKPELRRRLTTLGFVEGAQVKVVSESGGNFIIGIKGSHVALNCQVASHIMVTP